MNTRWQQRRLGVAAATCRRRREKEEEGTVSYVTLRAALINAAFPHSECLKSPREVCGLEQVSNRITFQQIFARWLNVMRVANYID